MGKISLNLAKEKNIFWAGFRGMLPIMMGIIPFGIVMGSVASQAHLSIAQSTLMNILVFAGASQLAAIELMTKNASSLVVIMTGLVINLRFLLYSAALSSVVQKSKKVTQFFCAYLLTDQNYAVMSANNKNFKSNSEAILFYFGTSLCMLLTWHLSVIAGFIFGNFAPDSLSLDFAVPLSFVALVIPTIKNRNYIYVTLFSSVVSLFFNNFPYKLGLIVTAVFSILFAMLLTRKKVPQ